MAGSPGHPRRPGSPGETAEEWDRLGAPPGLCRACRHAQLLASARSVFVRCGLADSDPRFARYPALPVSACDGHSPASSSR